MPKTANVNVRVESWIHTGLKRKAAAEGMGLSEFMRQVYLDILENNGADAESTMSAVAESGVEYVTGEGA